MRSVALLITLALVGSSARADIITIEGVVESVDIEKRTITVKSGAKERTLDVSSKAKIKI